MDDLISRQAVIAVADFSDYVGLSVDDVKKVTDEVIKGLKQLPSTQQWIPCSERPPEESGDYLVTVAHHSDELWVEVDQFDNTNGSWWHYMDDVIAWMPRPKPYQEG